MGGRMCARWRDFFRNSAKRSQRIVDHCALSIKRRVKEILGWRWKPLILWGDGGVNGGKSVEHEAVAHWQPHGSDRGIEIIDGRSAFNEVIPEWLVIPLGASSLCRI